MVVVSERIVKSASPAAATRRVHGNLPPDNIGLITQNIYTGACFLFPLYHLPSPTCRIILTSPGTLTLSHAETCIYAAWVLFLRHPTLYYATSQEKSPLGARFEVQTLENPRTLTAALCLRQKSQCEYQ